jgi:hypothetical protein
MPGTPPRSDPLHHRPARGKRRINRGRSSQARRGPKKPGRSGKLLTVTLDRSSSLGVHSFVRPRRRHSPAPTADRAEGWSSDWRRAAGAATTPAARLQFSCKSSSRVPNVQFGIIQRGLAIDAASRKSTVHSTAKQIPVQERRSEQRCKARGLDPPVISGEEGV